MSVHAATTVNLARQEVEDRWRSTGPASDWAGDADVSFRDAPGDRGTEIHVILDRDRPAGVLGEALQKVFGDDPLAELKDDLRRFKALVETGEVPRSDGTPEGHAVERQMRQRPAQPVEEVGSR
jgi:uncharacterized membrane protein